MNKMVTARLATLCDISTGKKDANEGSPDGVYPFFTCAEKHSYSETFSFDEEAILVAGNANIGRTKYYYGKFEAYQRTYVLRRFRGVDVRYLYSYLNAKLEIDLKAQAQSSAMSYIRLPMLEDYLIPLPPLDEQRKIAEVLRTWDEAIETAEAELKAKQERKRWLMQSVLSGSLRLKGCNKAWDKKRLDQVGTIVPGGTPSTSIPEYWNGDVPWVTPTEITKLKTPYIYKTEALITSEGVRNSSAALLPADSLIVCTRATVGVCAINKVPMTTNQGFKSVVPDSTDDTLFLYYVLNSMQSTFNRLAQGSTFLEISKTQFEKITIIWPSADERRLIASLMRTCDEQIESIGEAIEALRAQKRGLMQKLLTGEVRVAA